jgi:hypothetical protein
MESVDERALRVELNLRGIPFETQKRITVEAIAPIHTAQVLSYLKAMRLPLGLRINFNVPMLKNGVKRIVLTNQDW